MMYTCSYSAFENKNHHIVPTSSRLYYLGMYILPSDLSQSFTKCPHCMVLYCHLIVASDRCIMIITLTHDWSTYMCVAASWFLGHFNVIMILPCQWYIGRDLFAMNCYCILCIVSSYSTSHTIYTWLPFCCICSVSLLCMLSANERRHCNVTLSPIGCVHTWNHPCLLWFGNSFIYQGLYSLSCKTSYHQISWSLEAARLRVKIIVSLWNLTGISAVLLPRCLSNFKAIGKV